MVITAQDTKLKPGYKQTEIGVIPEDWDVKKLSMIAQFANGKAHEQFIDDKGDYIVVNSKFISTEGKVAKCSKTNISPLFSGDVVMVMSDVPNGRALAKCFYISVNGKYTLNQRICSLKAYDVDSLYLFYKLNRNQYFLNFDSGAGQTNLKKDEVLDCPIAIPLTMPEQRAIATALSDVDALIASLDKLIAKKRDIKQATMQQLLTGNTRLPGFSGELKPAYKKTEVGVIPEDWDVKNLGKLGRVIRGASPRPQGDRRYYGGNIPRLMVEDVTRDGKYVTPKVDFLTEEGAKRSRPCKKGTLIIVCSGTVGIPSFLTVDACIHDGFLALIDINECISKDYLYHQLMILNAKFEVSATHGGVFTNLTTSILNEFQIPLPSLPEQQAIATVLSDMDAEITALEQKRDKTRALKLGMMQELLTGKTRLV